MLRVRDGDEHKLAFSTNFGQFEFLVMPFGPCNAPGYFQSFMNSLLSHLPFVCVYLDDIIIFSSTPDEHLSHLTAVLSILLTNHLYCNLGKCQFFLQSLCYLGYIIANQKISMDPKKVAAILNWPIPSNVKELEAFLGFCNFYRSFLYKYSSLTFPLTALLKHDTRFTWNNSLTAAFESFKSAFTNALSLLQPDDHLPFEIESDASNFAIGSILSQRKPDKSLIPIAFYARQLSPAERNYPIHDKELLAIHDSFKEWRHYIQGTTLPVITWTDHNALKFFLTSM